MDIVQQVISTISEFISTWKVELLCLAAFIGGIIWILSNKLRIDKELLK